jgi:dihydroorotate dehydrogenase
LNIFPEIKKGIKDYLEKENLASITELTGRAHKQ